MTAVKTYLSSAMEYSTEGLTLIQIEGGTTVSYSRNTSLDLENKVGYRRQGILYKIISRSWKFPFQRDTGILHPIMDLVQLSQAFLRSIVWRMSLKELALCKQQNEDRGGVPVCHGCLFLL